ncbi:hypothetical protein M427DRAFT_60778 [Gonapodya prolifera JEL478]|uniref:NADH dehydrogenase [ubiquinone] 1 alpha subcomplex assembly factor 3 n=1 Tax=Gonapodya prolifera (strain JEL478) TaxID=1344416 RepID=A0A139A3H0_GONPJ|nr:hypothetical protein M427DRAFT_60778 [Gonapodya prolifera JEL478]|eukprot:KXS11366.1 hypothetical protein M427DRAFT_60778 [Gonapodya prolifera JEL478]
MLPRILLHHSASTSVQSCAHAVAAASTRRGSGIRAFASHAHPARHPSRDLQTRRTATVFPSSVSFHAPRATQHHVTCKRSFHSTPTTRQETPAPRPSLASFDIFASTRPDPAVGIPIDRLVDAGTVVSGVQYNGPVLIVGGKVLLWDVPQYGKGGPEAVDEDGLSAGQGEGESDAAQTVTTAKDAQGTGLFDGWSTDAFKVFEVLEHTPEILVFGTGAQFVPLPTVLRRYLHSLGIQCEVQKTRTASSTYNVLLSEGRVVAAALLPVVPTSARTGVKLDIYGDGKA